MDKKATKNEPAGIGPQNTITIIGQAPSFVACKKKGRKGS